MSANTIHLHRVLRATPEKIYRAFLDPDAMAKWLPPNGFTGRNRLSCWRNLSRLRFQIKRSIQEKFPMQKITPFLWFSDNAEEAVRFYVSIFKNSKIGKIARYDEAGEKVAGRPAGSVMTVEFQLEGEDFVALNGGPMFKFTEAISFVVNCETQEEVDYYWRKLSTGGKEVQCGWLKDRSEE